MSASLRCAVHLACATSRASSRATCAGMLLALWIALPQPSFAQSEPTQHETSLSDKLGLEGPLDNDTARSCNDVATRELAKADPARLPEALEAARRALVESSPGDAVCLDPRRSVGVELAVRRFIGANAAAFAERFEGLARAALDEAGNDERALERIEHENPFTKSAVTASLRRCDIAFERGERALARAALERARVSASAVPDALVDAAIAARRAALGSDARPLDERASVDRARTLVLASMVDYGVDASDDPSWHLQPSAAFGDRAWVQSAETLIAIDARSHATAFYPREVLAPLRASWNLAFGEEGQPWLQRPALDRDTGGRLALVLGRTKEKRGNALAVLDVSAAQPRALWVHAESGFAHADGTRSSEADALLAGRLEFQPGPVCFQGLVIAQVLQWFQAGVPPADQHVETAATIDWLVAFDLESGRVAWKQKIASGADRRARTASRFATERGLSCACAPLALQSGEVFVATELGLVARFDAASGALHETWRMRRARPATGVIPGFGGPISVPRLGEQGADPAPGLFAIESADSGGVAYVDGGDRTWPSCIPIDGGERLVAASGKNLLALVRTHDRLVLRTFAEGRVDPSGAPASRAESTPADPDALRTAASVPLPRGARWKGSIGGSDAILCVFDGRAVLFDLRRDLALRAAVDLPGLDGEGAAGLLVHDDTAYVLGTRRAWVLRLQ